MFTVKYIYPTGAELIEGPFESVSFSRQDVDGNATDGSHGHGVVFAERRDGDARITFGPIVPQIEGEPRGIVEPVVYVMNDRGTTVAKYHL